MRVLRARLDRQAGWPLIAVGGVLVGAVGVWAWLVFVDADPATRSRVGGTLIYMWVGMAVFGLACVVQGLRCLRGRRAPPSSPPAVPPGVPRGRISP